MFIQVGYGLGAPTLSYVQAQCNHLVLHLVLCDIYPLILSHRVLNPGEPYKLDS